MIDIVTYKIAAPYARALYDFAVENNYVYKITSDFRNLEKIFQTLASENCDLNIILANPRISKEEKKRFLTKIFEKKIHLETFRFLIFLINRDRISLLKPIVTTYILLMYETAKVKVVQVVTVYPLTRYQKNKLHKELEKLTNLRSIKMYCKTDSSLIAGIIIKTTSKVINLTLKNKFQKLAKHLDSVLEI